MKRIPACSVAVLTAATPFSSATAEYVISVVDADTGLSAATAYPGETIDLALLMTGASRFDAFGVWIEATPEALEFGDWVLDPIFGGWCKFGCQGPYIDGLTETGNTYWATVEVRVDLAAPVDSAIAIVPLVDFFAYGFDDVDVSPGTPFELTVVPEPTALAILGTGSLLAVVRRQRCPSLVRRRRRSRSHS